MLVQQLSPPDAPQSTRPAPEPAQLAPLVVDPVQAPMLHFPVAHVHGLFH
jgi:hypothetical protein